MNKLLSLGVAVRLTLANGAGRVQAVAARVCRLATVSFAMAFIGLQWASHVQGASLVVPGAYATTESNSALYRENLPPARFQQLYEAAEFASLGGPVLITGYLARPHAAQPGPAAVSVADLDYWMSTTSRTTETLSRVFAENRGTDHTLVASYDPAHVYTTANLPGPGNTKQFDVATMFSTPFLYDPAAGNLLLEARTAVTTLVSGSEFLTSACNTGPSSRVRMVISIGSADATSGEYQELGEIDLFLYEPIAAADFTKDGVVDAADLAQWQAAFGLNADCDADGDDDTDGADFLIWQRQYVAGVPGLASQLGIPEPSAGLLALFAVGAALVCSRSSLRQRVRS